MRIINSIIRKIINLCAGISAITALLMLIITVWDIIGRKFFNSPVSGVYELTSIGLVVITFTGIGLAQLEGENLGITLLYDKFSDKVKSVFDFFIAFISISLFLVVFTQTLKFAQRMTAANQVTSVLRIPISPWVYLTAFGILVLILAFIKDILDSIKIFKGDKTDEQ